MTPTTGVIHNCAAQWWLEEALYNGIDIDYLGYLDEQMDQGGELDDWELECWDTGTLLVGFKPTDDKSISWYWHDNPVVDSDAGMVHGLAPDQNAEVSAIVGEVNTQIVRSDYAVRCNRCSPCYPLQGDIETPGDDYLAYCFPPDMFDPADDFDLTRIERLTPYRKVKRQEYARWIGIVWNSIGLAYRLS